MPKYLNGIKITETSKMLDRMKDLGFKYSTKAGITIGIADIVVLEEKHEIIEEARRKSRQSHETVQTRFNHGRRTLQPGHIHLE